MATRLPLVAVALILTGASSFIVVENPDLFHFEIVLSLRTLAFLLLVAAMGWLTLKHAQLGLVLLVVFVYLNLSQVLVRYHSLPSLLQLLVVPIAIVAWRGVSAIGALRRPPPALMLLLVAYNLVLLLSSTWARDVALAEERWVENTKALLIYLLVVGLASSTARLRAAVWSVVGGATLLSGLAILQVITDDFRNEYGGLARVKDAHIYGGVFEQRIAGPLGDPNFFAQSLLIAVPLAVVLAWREERQLLRMVAWLCAGAVTVGTVLTYSRGGALSLGAALVVVFLSRRHHWKELASLAAGLLLVSTLLPSSFSQRLLTVSEILPGKQEVLHPDSAIEERRLFVAVAWRIFLERPLLGVGAGNYSAHYDEVADLVGSDSRFYGDPDERHFPHSLYLEIAAETGLLGLSIFGLVVSLSMLSLARVWRRLKRAGNTLGAELAAALGASLVGYLVAAILLHGHFQRYLWLLFALVSSLQLIARSAPEVE